MWAALPPPCFRCRVSTVNVVSACLQKDTSRGEEGGCQCGRSPVTPPRPPGRAPPLHLPSWSRSASRDQPPRTGWCRGSIASTWDGSDGPSQPPGAQRTAEATSRTTCPLCADLLPEGTFPQSTCTELSQPQSLCARALTLRYKSMLEAAEWVNRRLLSVIHFSLLFIHSFVELMPVVHSH